MTRFVKPRRLRRPRSDAMLLAAIAGLATAGFVGVAIAKTFTLQVATNAKVTNQMGSTTRENIATSRGFAVYDLTGDSKRHPECTKTNGCFRFWPPVTVGSAKKLSKASGISGKLGVWHRDGFSQVTLGGHPLYRFALDTQRGHATGEDIHSFGGTWHVIKAAGPTSGATTMTTGTTTMPTGTTTMPAGTTTTSCLYAPCP